MRMQDCAATLLAACGLVIALPATATTISLIPAAANVRPGDTVSLDLVIAGLADGAAPSLGDFDIDLSFDPAALGFQGYTLGSGLGGPGEALDVSFGFFPPGGVNVAQVSLLTVDELNLNQPDTFVLTTLTFEVITLAPGATTAIDVSGVFALGDANGDPIPLDGTTGAVLTGVAIPLPASLWLLASALVLLLRRPPIRARNWQVRVDGWQRA